MIKMLKNILLLTMIFTSAALFAQTTITWTGTPGEVETAVADAGGEGDFVLEAGRVYGMLSNITVEEGKILTITGAEADGVQKASLQPVPNEEGVVPFGVDGAPGEMFWTVGAGSEIHLDNLLLNGMALDQSKSVGIAGATGTDNHIHANNCIVNGVGALAFFTVGSGTDFTLRDNVVTGFTSYPGGAFYGGVVWGAGSWMGTMDMLIVERNTFHGVIGEAIVAYEFVEEGSKVDHNTFANISMGAFYYYTANNLQITNNVFYNTRTWGQTRYDAGLNPVVDANGDPVLGDDGNQTTNGWGVVWPGGTGQLESRAKMLGSSEVDADGNKTYMYTMANDGQVVDMNNRNVHWGNNAVVWSPELIDWVNTHAGTDADGDGYGDTPCYSWTTTVTEEDGTEYDVTIEDHQLVIAHQAVVHSDTTLNNVARGVGVTASDNALLAADEFGMHLDPGYIVNQLARNDDFKDNQTTDGVAATHEWRYLPEGATHAIMEYPLHLDLGYNETSAAATWSTLGGPVGDPRWMGGGTVGTDSESVPETFSLRQNYPNPFNPTTEIAFSLDNTSNISLTIFNALGQEVKVLANGTKKAGVHSVKWDGRDASGAAVSTGLYFYTLSDGNKSFTKKMALMK
jgi:hypothetical protein